MQHIGFSTGAVAGGDFRSALAMLATGLDIDAIELSCLRIHELGPLLEAIPSLDLARYQYISVHAPSSFSPQQEWLLVPLLSQLVPTGWPIILHPDTIHDHAAWRRLGSRVAIENMDVRKTGRTVAELMKPFALLPEARFCFDAGHARQCDPTMNESSRMLDLYGERLVEVHVSEVTKDSRHEPMSYGAALAFQSIARRIHPHIPLIVESQVAPGELAREVEMVRESFPW
jgi:hypothetical protein